jgi:hypothetical protein
MNEGGRVLWAGKKATQQYSGAAVGNQFYDPQGGSVPCRAAPEQPTVAYRCLALRGSGDGVNDVLQYWYGAFLVTPGAGSNPDGGMFDATGVGAPFSGMEWGFDPATAGGATDNASFITTSGILPPSEYPQFTSTPAARYVRPGGPFEPHTGSSYVYSNIADVSFKRLTKTVSVPAGGGHLKFWASYDTEADWDHLAVEARTAGGDDWTTLPDLNGHTSQATGESCPAGWRELHPQLDHYQTVNEDGTCAPHGTTGDWNADSGGSNGWVEWDVDLGAYAGEDVELSISYISDWGTQGLGVFLDDVSDPGGSTSFEDGLGGWEVTGPPPGSGPNSNNWTRTGAAGFPEGAAIRTARSLLLGFGLEQVDTDANRAAIMGAAMQDLIG